MIHTEEEKAVAKKVLLQFLFKHVWVLLHIRVRHLQGSLLPMMVWLKSEISTVLCSFLALFQAS